MVDEKKQLNPESGGVPASAELGEKDTTSAQVLAKKEELQEKIHREIEELQENNVQAHSLPLLPKEKLELEQTSAVAQQKKDHAEKNLRHVPIEAGIETPELERIEKNYEKIKEQNPDLEETFIKNAAEKLGFEDPEKTRAFLEGTAKQKSEERGASRPEKKADQTFRFGVSEKLEESSKKGQKREHVSKEKSFVERMHDIDFLFEKKLRPGVKFFWKTNFAALKKAGEDKIQGSFQRLNVEEALKEAGISTKDFFDYLEYRMEREASRSKQESNEGVPKPATVDAVSAPTLRREEVIEKRPAVEEVQASTAVIHEEPVQAYSPKELPVSEESAPKSVESLTTEEKKEGVGATENNEDLRQAFEMLFPWLLLERGKRAWAQKPKNEDMLKLVSENMLEMVGQASFVGKAKEASKLVSPQNIRKYFASTAEKEETKNISVANNPDETFEATEQITLSEKMEAIFPPDMLRAAKDTAALGTEEQKAVAIERLVDYMLSQELDGRLEIDDAPTTHEIIAYVTGKAVEEVEKAAEEAPASIEDVFQNANIPIEEVQQTFDILPREKQVRYVEQLQITYPEIEATGKENFLDVLLDSGKEKKNNNQVEKISSHNAEQVAAEVSFPVNPEEAKIIREDYHALDNEAEKQEFIQLLKQKNLEYKNITEGEIKNFFEGTIQDQGEVVHTNEFPPLLKFITNQENEEFKRRKFSIEEASPGQQGELYKSLVKSLQEENGQDFMMSMSALLEQWNPNLPVAQQERVSKEVYEGMQEYIDSRAAQSFMRERIQKQIVNASQNVIFTLSITTLSSILSGGSAAVVLGAGALAKFAATMWKRGFTEKQREDRKEALLDEQKYRRDRIVDMYSAVADEDNERSVHIKEKMMKNIEGLVKNAVQGEDDRDKLMDKLEEYSEGLNEEEKGKWRVGVLRLSSLKGMDDYFFEDSKARSVAKIAKNFYEGATGLTLNKKALQANTEDKAMILGLGGAAVGGAVAAALRSDIARENLPLVRGVMGAFTGLSMGVSLDEFRLHKLRKDRAEKIIEHLEELASGFEEDPKNLYENVEAHKDDYESAIALLGVSKELKLPKVFTAKIRNFIGEYQMALIRTNLERKEKADNFVAALETQVQNIPDKRKEIFAKMQGKAGLQTLKSAAILGGMTLLGATLTASAVFAMEKHRTHGHNEQTEAEAIDNQKHQVEKSASAHEEAPDVHQPKPAAVSVRAEIKSEIPLEKKYAVLLESGADIQKENNGKIHFEIPFGEGAKQKNFENALDFLAAQALAEEMKKQHMNIKIDEVFATRMLNIGGGNLRAAFEGKGLEEVQKTLQESGAHLENGKIIIPDYQKFESTVLHPLVTRAMNNIKSENVENTGAVEYVPHINTTEVLEKIRHGMAHEQGKKDQEVVLENFQKQKHGPATSEQAQHEDEPMKHALEKTVPTQHPEKSDLIQRGPHGEIIQNEGEILAPDYNHEIGSDNGIMAIPNPNEVNLHDDIMHQLHVENTPEGHSRFNTFLQHYEIDRLMSGSSPQEKVQFAWQHQADMSREAVYRVLDMAENLEKYIPQHINYEQVKSWFDQGIQVRSIEQDRMVLSFENNNAVHMFTIQKGGVVSLENLDGSNGIFTSAFHHAIFEPLKNLANLNAETMKDAVLKMEMQAVGSEYTLNTIEELSKGKNWRGQMLELNPLTRERFLNAPVSALFDEKGKTFEKFLAQFEQLSRAEKKILGNIQEHIIPENQKQEIAEWLQKNPQYGNMRLRDALEAHFARIAGRHEQEFTYPHGTGLPGADNAGNTLEATPLPTSPEHINEYNPLNPKFSENSFEGKNWLKGHLGKIWEDGEGKKYVVGKGSANTHIFGDMINGAKATAIRSGIGVQEFGGLEQRGLFVEGSNAYVVFEIKK